MLLQIAQNSTIDLTSGSEACLQQKSGSMSPFFMPRLNESDPRYDISKEGLFIANMSEADVGDYECTILTPADRQVLVTSVYDPNATQWWIIILLIALILVALLLLCGCCVYCVRKRSYQSGRYGVKDIEDGRKKANR